MVWSLMNNQKKNILPSVLEDDKVQYNFGKPIQNGFCKAKRKVALTITTVGGVCVARGALRPGWGRCAPHAQLGRRVQRRAGVA